MSCARARDMSHADETSSAPTRGVAASSASVNERPGTGTANALKRRLGSVEEVFPSAHEGIEPIDPDPEPARHRGGVRSRVEFLQDLDAGFRTPAAHTRQDGVRDGCLPARGPRFENALVGAARSLGPNGSGEVSGRLDGTGIDEGQVCAPGGARHRVPENALRIARVAGREGGRRGEEHLVGAGRRGRRQHRHALDARGAHRPCRRRKGSQRSAVVSEHVDFDRVVFLRRSHACNDAQLPGGCLDARESCGVSIPQFERPADDLHATGPEDGCSVSAQHDADALRPRNVDVDHHLADSGALALGGQVNRAASPAHGDWMRPRPERTARHVRRLDARVSAVDRAGSVDSGHGRPGRGADDEGLLDTTARRALRRRRRGVAAVLCKRYESACEERLGEQPSRRTRRLRDVPRDYAPILGAIGQRSVRRRITERRHRDRRERVERRLESGHLPRVPVRRRRIVHHLQMRPDGVERVSCRVQAKRLRKRAR